MKFQFSLAQFVAIVFTGVMSGLGSSLLVNAFEPREYWFYGYELATGDLWDLRHFHRSHEMDQQLDVELINRWLRDSTYKLPADYPQLDHPGADPWRNPYRCIASPIGISGDPLPYGYMFFHGSELTTVCAEGQPKEGAFAVFGFMSLGEDGISETNGNDPDDLNTWDLSSSSFYGDRAYAMSRRQHWQRVLFVFPFVFFACTPVTLLWLRYFGNSKRRR